MYTAAPRTAEPAASSLRRAARRGLTVPGPAAGTPAIQSAGECPGRLGDAIDDRVAEAVEEMLGQQAALRPDARLRPALAGLALFLATAASVMLRHNVVAVCTIWPCTAAIYLAAIRFTEAGRS
jgi:hypothetical protein